MSRGLLQIRIPAAKAGAIVFGVAVLSHLTFLRNGFTWLDRGDIQEGRAILSLSQIPQAFFLRFGSTGFYRPLVTLFHSVDRLIFGLSPFGYHLTDLCLQGLCSVAVLFFLTEFFALSSGTALAGAIVFAVHPVSWLTVGSISYRSELLFTLFALFQIFFHAKYRRQNRKNDLYLSLGCLALALFSKETALLVCTGLITIWEMTEPSKGASEGRGRILLAEAGIVICYLILRRFAVPEVWHISAASMSLSENVGTRLLALERFFTVLVSPFKPLLSDAVPRVAFSWLLLLESVAPLALFLGLGLRKLKNPLAVRLGLSFTLFLLPMLNLVALPRFTSAHYAYASTALVSVVFLVRERLLKYFLPLLLVWALLASQTLLRSGPQFKNDLTLFSKEVEADPDFLEGRHYLGDYHFFHGDMGKAREQYEAVLARNASPVLAYVDLPALLVNFAGVCIAEKKLDDAEKYLKTALAQSGKTFDPQINYNLALVALRRGQPEAVIKELASPPVPWTRAEPYLMLAQVYETLGRYTDAAIALEQTLPWLSEDKKHQVNQVIERLRGKSRH